MEWLSKILVTVLVVTGIFVAVVSGCQWSSRFVADGGSCSNTQFDAPAIPHAALPDVALPVVRLDLIAILVAVVALVVPVELVRRTNAVPSSPNSRPRRIEFSMRD
ncbi:hypothetical protein EBS80_02900 [bacterium]|nr:hypothetical protein [bacterium]